MAMRGGVCAYVRGELEMPYVGVHDVFDGKIRAV
tara:strand:- start:68 stop:169 length:102 start_codon:yes stop_codon:yes gene_type:complete